MCLIMNTLQTKDILSLPLIYCHCVCFSTVSSSINALVAVTVEDFVRPVWKNLTEKQVSWINMGLSEFHTKQ